MFSAKWRVIEYKLRYSNFLVRIYVVKFFDINWVSHANDHRKRTSAYLYKLQNDCNFEKTALWKYVTESTLLNITRAALNMFKFTLVWTSQ